MNAAITTSQPSPLPLKEKKCVEPFHCLTNQHIFLFKNENLTVLPMKLVAAYVRQTFHH